MRGLGAREKEGREEQRWSLLELRLSSGPAEALNLEL